MGRFVSVLWLLGRIALGIGASLAFFIIIPLLHQTFGVHIEQEKKQQHRIVAEMEFKPKPPEEKKTVQRVRQVSSSQPGSRSSSSPQAMRFTPDLGLDAGGGDGEGVFLQSRELAAEVFEEGQTDQDPIPEHVTQIPYPARARELAIEGDLEVLIVINHSGRVSSMDFVKSPHPSFVSEARRVISTWRFKPARNKGVAVSVRKRVVYSFTLER